MPEHIGTILISLLALYGAVVLVVSVVSPFFRSRGSNRKGVRLILLVKNRQESVEGMVSGLLAADLIWRILRISRLTVIDASSTDETSAILRKLNRQYDRLEVFDRSEIGKVFEELEHPDEK